MTPVAEKIWHFLMAPEGACQGNFRPFRPWEFGAAGFTPNVQALVLTKGRRNPTECPGQMPRADFLVVMGAIGAVSLSTHVQYLHSLARFQVSLVEALGDSDFPVPDAAGLSAEACEHHHATAAIHSTHWLLLSSLHPLARRHLHHRRSEKRPAGQAPC